METNKSQLLRIALTFAASLFWVVYADDSSGAKFEIADQLFEQKNVTTHPSRGITG